MSRILVMMLRNFFALPFIWWQLCYYAKHVDRYTKEERRKLLRGIVSRANRGGKVTVEIFGKELLPKDEGFLMFPNHQGLYDVLAVVDACPSYFSVVYKKEVGRNLFLRKVFSVMKAYSLDREDIRQSMQVISSVSKEVKEGTNFLIFPEGTRSMNGNTLLDFKAGSFKAATMAKCPIVPVALIDAFKPFDSKTIKPVSVQVHFLKPMYFEDYKGMKTVDIAREVKEKIEATIQRYEVNALDVGV